MRFLFATWDGGGNVPPALAIARQLAERGHSVRVMGTPALRLRFEEAGCAFVPYVRVPARLPPAPRAAERVRAMLLVPELVRAAPILAYAEDVLSECERETPDVLVVDFMLAGAVASGERAGIPTAALRHTLCCFRARRPVPRAALRELNDARRTLGLVPVASAAEQLTGVQRVLVLTTDAFDRPPAPQPANLRFVGPQLEPSEPFENPGSIVVSFSSRHAASKVVQRVLDALAKVPVDGLVTLGPALAAADLRLPRNVVARTFVPHGAVLPSARLVITHAGLGTVMAALAHGVPLLCIPLKNDQFENATRVVAVGAGLRLGGHARRSAIERAVQRILDDRRFRDGAARMAEAVAAYDGLAVAELEALGAARYANGLSSPAATFLKPSP